MCSHQVTCSTCCSSVSLCLSLFITDSLDNASHCTHLAFDERLHSTWILLCIRFLLTFLISSSSSRRTISASKQFYFSWAHSSFIAFQPRTHRHRDMHMLALACSALTPISLTKFHMWWYMPFAAFAMPLPAAHRLLVRQAYQLNPLAPASLLPLHWVEASGSVCVNSIWLTLRVSATDSNCNQFTFVLLASELKTSLEIFLSFSLFFFLVPQPCLPFHFAFSCCVRKSSLNACVRVCLCLSLNFIIWHLLLSSRLFVCCCCCCHCCCCCCSCCCLYCCCCCTCSCS